MIQSRLISQPQLIGRQRGHAWVGTCGFVARVRPGRGLVDGALGCAHQKCPTFVPETHRTGVEVVRDLTILPVPRYGLNNGSFIVFGDKLARVSAGAFRALSLGVILWGEGGFCRTTTLLSTHRPLMDTPHRHTY